MASLSSGVTNHQNYDNTGKRKRSSSASPNVISSSSSSAVWTLLFNFSLFLICLFPCLLNNSSLNLNNNNVNNAGRGGGVGVSNYFVLFAEATPIEGNEEMSLNAGSTAASAGYLNDLNSSQQFGTASTGQEEYDNVAQNGDDAAAEAGDDNQANNANNESFVDNNNAEQNNKNGANQKKGVFRRFKDYVSKNKLFVGIGAAATATALIAGSYKLNCFPGNYYGDGRKQFEGLGDNATWKDQVKSFIPGTEANKKTGGVFSRLKNYLWKDNSPKDNSPNPQNGNNPQNPQNGNGNNPQGNPQNPQGNPQNTETPQTETPQTPTPVPSKPVPNPQGQDNPNGQDTGAQGQDTGAQPQKGKGEPVEPVKAPKPKAEPKGATPAAPVVAPPAGKVNVGKMPTAVNTVHPNGEVWLQENTDDGYKAYLATAGSDGDEVLVNIIKQGKVTTYTDVTSPSVWTYENLGGTDVLIGSVTRGTRGDRQVDDSKKFDGNGNVLECKRSNVMGSRDPFFSYLVEGNFLGGKDKQGQFRGDGNANVRLQNNEQAVKITFKAEVKEGEQYLTVMKFNEKKEVVEAKKLKAIWNSDTRRPTVPEIDQKDKKKLYAIQSEFNQYVDTAKTHWNDWKDDDGINGEDNKNKNDEDKKMTFDYQDINGDNKQETLAKKDYQEWWKNQYEQKWKKK